MVSEPPLRPTTENRCRVYSARAAWFPSSTLSPYPVRGERS